MNPTTGQIMHQNYWTREVYDIMVIADDGLVQRSPVWHPLKSTWGNLIWLWTAWQMCSPNYNRYDIVKQLHRARSLVGGPQQSAWGAVYLLGTDRGDGARLPENPPLECGERLVLRQWDEMSCLRNPPWLNSWWHHSTSGCSPVVTGGTFATPSLGWGGLLKKPCVTALSMTAHDPRTLSRCDREKVCDPVDGTRWASCGTVWDGALGKGALLQEALLLPRG